MDKMLDLKYQAEMPEIRTLLKDYFNQYMSKQSPNSFKTNQNRCFSAIPSVPIYMKDLGRSSTSIVMATGLCSPCSSVSMQQITFLLVTSK